MALHRDQRELGALLLQSEIVSTWNEHWDGPYRAVTVNLACSTEALDLLRPYSAETRLDDGSLGYSPLQALLNEVWPADEWVAGVNVTARLETPAPDWREQLRDLIESGPTNQGRPYGNSRVLTYNGLNYRTRGEIAIAQVLELSDEILFLPNCAALAGKVLKEADFLIFYKRRVGILEVDGGSHFGRAADDSLRDSFFQKQGIFIKHYPSEKCESDATWVVRDFLRLLGKAP
jgi:hypothetical protein